MQIRNFSIVAHIDHGKSTLSDRLLMRAGAITEREFKDQILDDMDLERERGITIKASAVTVFHEHKGEKFMLNFIDTPGHVDFHYEVQKALQACEGAILVVDATQGVQAQTVANAYAAIDAGLEIIPVINKIDLPSAQPVQVAEEIEQVLGFSAEDAILVSAKTGQGIDELLSKLCDQLPPPKGNPDEPTYRIAAQGIDVHGAKQSAAATDRPFTRILIHHNKVVDSLINVDDFGGIETWQGGPAYVFDNISGNPGGYRNWEHVLSPDKENRFGHAYYLDGAFKNYYFNNIAWGKSKGPAGRLANTSAFQEIISYQNTFFNNTIYNFVRGSRRQEPQAGRVKFLGNIWQSMGERVFRDADPANTAASGNEADAGPAHEQFAIDTDAYARNVCYDTGPTFAVVEPSGRWLNTLDAFRDFLEKHGSLAAQVGVMAGQPPLRDAAAHDFRPSADSAARAMGAKVFVPWSLYETVAEWNFCPIWGDPRRILDEHWCMAPYYTVRDNYYRYPTYPLTGVHINFKCHENGPLENWTPGTLRFNGFDQYAVLSNQDIIRPVTLEGQNGVPDRQISGADLSNPQIYNSNFLIESYFKTTPGKTDGTLLQKMSGGASSTASGATLVRSDSASLLDGVGYALRVNEVGGITLSAQAAGAKAALASRRAVNDGQWHHIIAEADRAAGTFTLYIDGKQDGSGPGLRADVSLANGADLYVGGTPQGYDLNGVIAFMRIARGTLADSKTTIEELYAWEFSGPFLDDFTGRHRPSTGGEAGALDE